MCPTIQTRPRSDSSLHKRVSNRESQWPAAASRLTKQSADTFEFGPSPDCGATEVKLYYSSLSSRDPSASTWHSVCVCVCSCVHRACVDTQISVLIKTNCVNVEYMIPESVALTFYLRKMWQQFLLHLCQWWVTEKNEKKNEKKNDKI